MPNDGLQKSVVETPRNKVEKSLEELERDLLKAQETLEYLMDQFAATMYGLRREQDVSFAELESARNIVRRAHMVIQEKKGEQAAA